MPVVCLGVAHQSAPLAVREQFAFSSGARQEFLAALADQVVPLGIAELALLTTCNRTELYAATGDAAHRFGGLPTALPRLLAQHRGLPLALLQRHAYARADLDAVRHLCRVAAGLESMVLGEAEILGQVGEAQEAAERGGTLGTVLRGAFETAVRAGRRARADTAIARTAVSVSSEAVRMVEALGVDLAAAHVLLVGTGKVGRLAARALRAHGVRELAVISRTAASAEELAGACGAQPLPWHALEAALRDADVVFTGTGAPHAVLTRELMLSALQRRAEGRQLLLVDLAVPRDVEPGVDDLPGVAVRNLDDVQRRVAGNLDGRRREIGAVEAIVADEVERFEAWLNGIELRPVLAALAAYGEAERRRVLQRALARRDAATPELREQLEAVTRTLVARLLHAPLRRLRDESDPIRREQQAELVRELFGLAPGALSDTIEAR
jgi:glutamyl-tRNA reductase